MADTRVARKYATGLFVAARSAGITSALWDDLSGLGEILRSERRLLRVLASPQLSSDEKKNLIGRIMGESVQATIRNFVYFLIDKGRTGDLPKMIELYRGLLDQAEGIVEATITSAVALTSEEEKQIVARLESLSGRKLRYQLKIAPEILGGIVVILGGQIIDHSVKNDLLRLRDTLRAVKVHEAA